MANVETVEAMFPIRYLFRRRLQDSGGGGKFRGGTGGELAIVAHDAPQGGLHYVLSGKGSQFPQSEGLLGGNPGSNNDYVWVHSQEDNSGDKDFSQSVETIPGDKEAISWGVFPLMGNDSLYVRWNGGGGVGDPITRDPKDVLIDYHNQTISQDAVSSLYGVVLEHGHVDVEETKKLRSRIRHSQNSQDLGQQELRASVATLDNFVVCSHCNFRLSERGTAWKDNATVDVKSFVTISGSSSSVNQDAILREFTCPECGTLLDTETALPGDPFLNDILS